MNITGTFYDLSWEQKYCITFYNAILQLLGNDIGPTNIPLYIIGIILLVVGALIQANLFGSMTNILGTINRKANKF